MAVFFVPDNVAAEAHRREIPDHLVAGLPLPQAVAIIHAWDSCNIEGADALQWTPQEQEYDQDGDTGALLVNTDRDHWYGIVYNPRDTEAARRKAEEIFKEWCEDGEDDEDD